MKKRITCLILLVLFIGGIAGNSGTFAWFVASGEGSQQFVVGDLDFTLYGSLSGTSSLGTVIAGEDTVPLIVPNQPLLNTLSATDYTALTTAFPTQTIPNSTPYMCLTNASTIDSQLRIKVEYTLSGGAGGTIQYADSAANCPMEVTFVDDSAWDSEGNYFYYGTYSSGNSDVVATTDTFIPLFSSIAYSGSNTMGDSAVDNQNVYIRVVFEARQSEYANWETIGTISN